MFLNSRYSWATDTDWKPAANTKGASTETCWMTYPDTREAADVSLEGSLDICLVRVSVRK
jgi:hypothetical protein